MSDNILTLAQDDWLENQRLVFQMYVEFPQRIQSNHKTTYKYFEKFLEDRNFEAVADIGCAYRPFYDKYVGTKLSVAVDPLITEFLDFGFNIPFQKHTPSMSSIPTSFFDGLFCINGLGYMENPNEEIAQMSRILDEDGLLFLTHDFGDDFSYHFFDKNDLAEKINKTFQPHMLKIVGPKLYYVGSVRNNNER